MSRGSWIGIGLAFAVAIGAAAPIQAAGEDTSPESDKRERLGGKLGIPTKRPPPADDDPDTDDKPGDDDKPPTDGPADNPEPAPPSTGNDTPPPSTAPREATTVVFAGKVHRSLKSGCKACHGVGGSAGGTKFVMTGDVADDYRSARTLVKPGNPGSSALLSKAAGKGHGGGAPFADGSAAHGVLRDWINDGASRGGGGTARTPIPPIAVAPISAAPAPVAPPPASTTKSRQRAAPGVPAEPASASPPAALPPRTETPPSHAFAPDVHALLLAKCKSCHQAGAIGGNGRMSLSGDVTADHATALALVVVGDPNSSVLASKASGVEHGGGPTLPPGSEGERALRVWISAGALGPASPTPASAEPDGDLWVDATTGASPPVAKGERLGDGTALGPQLNASPGPSLHLPLSLRLHGKFDFSYEHRDWKDQPFQKGRAAFQTYHHFLFLSRVADDPFGINVELLTQAFYEFSGRVAPKGRNFDALFKAGKILVPFGNEPLFHRSYGGRSGFDQEIFPAIWAQPGIAGSLHARAGPIALSNDTYVVQGYALREPDGVLNLQSDTSTVDEFRAAFGDRIGVSWKPLSGWYSLQVNRLGHDRLLVMQAIDLEFWRLHGVPFVEDVVLGIGGMRADVSGGGPGTDYYHFGSYASVAYYPIDFLSLQYRAGLRTTDNRRGVYYDPRRADERDRSSHNISIMGRWRGLYAGLQLFWNLEKANERDDDFMRVTVGYEF